MYVLYITLTPIFDAWVQIWNVWLTTRFSPKNKPYMLRLASTYHDATLFSPGVRSKPGERGARNFGTSEMTATENDDWTIIDAKKWNHQGWFMPHSERHVQIPNVVSIHATDPRLIFKSFAGSLSTCPSYISNFDQHILHRTLLYLQRKPALRCRRSSALRLCRGFPSGGIPNNSNS